MTNIEKLAEILEKFGIKIYDENGACREFNVVIEEIGKVYGMLNKKTQDEIKRLLLDGEK